jgi:CheY-like chemotaxis protein
VSVAQSVRPAAIVMDLEMPAMGGSEATRALKQDERTKSIPIIVLTGSSRDSQLSDGQSCRLQRAAEEALCAGGIA